MLAKSRLQSLSTISKVAYIIFNVYVILKADICGDKPNASSDVANLILACLGIQEFCKYTFAAINTAYSGFVDDTRFPSLHRRIDPSGTMAHIWFKSNKTIDRKSLCESDIRDIIFTGVGIKESSAEGGGVN